MTTQQKNLIGAAKKARDFLSIVKEPRAPFDDFTEQVEIWTELDKRIKEAEAEDISIST